MKLLFNKTSYEIPLSKVYLPGLSQLNSMHNVRKSPNLEIKSSGTVIHLREIISLKKWTNAWSI